MKRFVLFVLLLLASCKPEQQHGLVIAGSTSVAPFMEMLAEEYMLHHDIVINVQGGGSTAGIVAAESGAADLGMASRDLKAGENLDKIVIARDGLAVIVNPKLPIDNLLHDDVVSIFSGKTEYWENGRKITVIVREEGSGTRGAFQELVMGDTRMSPKALVQDSNGAVREMVSNDPYAIGFISVGLVNEQVKALSLDGIRPEEGNYNLVRPFLVVHSGPLDKDAQEFMDFVLGDGQEILKSEGLIGS